MSYNANIFYRIFQCIHVEWTTFHWLGNWQICIATKLNSCMMFVCHYVTKVHMHLLKGVIKEYHCKHKCPSVHLKQCLYLCLAWAFVCVCVCVFMCVSCWIQVLLFIIVVMWLFLQRKGKKMQTFTLSNVMIYLIIKYLYNWSA